VKIIILIMDRRKWEGGNSGKRKHTPSEISDKNSIHLWHCATDHKFNDLSDVFVQQ